MIIISGTVVEVSASTRNAWVSVDDRGLVRLPLTRAQVPEFQALMGQEVRLSVVPAQPEERDGTATLYGPGERAVDHADE